MNNKSLWISLVAVILSFAGGFLLANALNRGQLDIIKGENDRLRASQASDAKDKDDVTLNNDEIQTKVAEADQNLQNFQFQKNLGLALYRYSAMKQDAKILPDAIRLLTRAYQLDSGDRDIQIGLGNAHFDTGYFNKDNKSFESAREFYRKALVKTPSDVEVRTDLGLTYFLVEPPELPQAIEQFESSLKIDPKHEKTLEFMVQSLVKSNDGKKASEYLDQLKKANPDNQSIRELSSLVSQISTTPVK